MRPPSPPPPSPEPQIVGTGRWADLSRRLGSGVLVAGVGLALLFLGGIFLAFGLAILMGALMWELSRVTAVQVPGRVPHHPEMIATMAAVVFFAVTLFGGWAAVLFAAPLFVGWRRSAEAQRGLFVAFAIAFLGAGLSLIWLRESIGLGTALWLVATAVQSDVLGYFVGRSVGGPKFWPAISPKKTWSGTSAGWIGAFVLAALLVAFDGSDWSLLILGPLIAFAGQMGDIAESWLKRRTGIKDSSRLIPGHGGVMDRFDALTAALLVAALAGMLGMEPPRIGG
ncbi:phosphatidate cytidylyltransferase [Paracoccus sp. Z118]|uniref:phosphatidate cytidylyltransferase n=1 Tax=Paracoccus sp. Z118 TaxID=2851017 RepID=UPI001C2BF177|nr:phosphatidate cytidylyltransferase [Paracoccus sp. Z118]MBV0890484.1 phosphatidate cytidylyltransferase [Paracoccus sp. Z118]